MASSPMILDAAGKPLPLTNDGVTEAIESASSLRLRHFGSAMARMFAPQLAYAAYRESGMLQRVIDLPAADRVREWRDWQANPDQIEALEKEEQRLGLKAKIKAAEILRGLGGGALILITLGPSDQKFMRNPLTARDVQKGCLVGINVVSKDQLTLVDIEQDVGRPNYGLPRAFKVGRGSDEIHPSRVVCFRGAPLFPGYGVGYEEAFWGQSRLTRVFREVEKSDNAQFWFAALIKKAKLLRIGIPNLTDSIAAPGGQDRLNRRMGAIATGESVLDAVVYDAGDGKEGAGEKVTDYQINWSGIPAMMDAFDQRVAAVSGIPFTVLQGRSPGGMNATGDHDRQNWNREVAQGQNLDLAPCLDQIDEVLIPSALGSRPPEIWYKFAPLSTPTDKEETDRFKVWTEAMDKVSMSNAMPAEIFNRGYQAGLIENGFMTGIEEELKKLPDDERYGLTPGDDGTDEDPSALQSGREADPTSAGRGGSADPKPARRAANDAVTWLSDATPRPLYVQRKLLNAADLIAWAKDNGFAATLPASDMHVTVLYSRTAVDPMKMGRDWRENEKGQLIVRPGGPRVIEKLGENAVVLRFASPDLEWRHKDMVEAGGSHDWPEYAPHVTISYSAPDGVDIEALKPFNGELRFGPEIFEALDLDWKSKITEA